MEAHLIVAGLVFQYWDDEEERTFKTEVIKTIGDTVYLKDIDLESPDYGIEWEDNRHEMVTEERHDFQQK
jgi:hypothetical protein